MEIRIQEKPVKAAITISCMDNLKTYKVIEKTEHVFGNRAEKLKEFIDVDDVLLRMPSPYSSGIFLLNATKGKMMYLDFDEGKTSAIKLKRDYNTQSVILCYCEDDRSD